MIIEKCTVDQIPAGSVRLSDAEVLEHIWKAMNNWKFSKEVAPFIYGPGGLSMITAVSLLQYTLYYRRRFKLHNQLRATMIGACVALPTIFSAGFHLKLVSSDIILQRPCKLCVQTKAMAIQTLFTVGYGVITPYFFGIYISNLHATIEDAPKLADYGKLYVFWKKLMKRQWPRTYFWLGLSVTAATVVTILEYYCFEKFYIRWINVQRERSVLKNHLEKN